MELVEFLRNVVTAKEGWFCLAHADVRESDEETTKTWTEEFFEWPTKLPEILNRIAQLGTQKEVYFSPHLFSEPCSKKQYAIAGRTIVADLDEANILTLQIKPTILVETSNERHQGYWVTKEFLDKDEHEQLSKKLTYSIPRCDRTGWFLGKKVRVPTTYNHKYTVGPQLVRVVDSTGRTYASQELDEVTSVKELFGNVDVVEETNFDWIEKALDQPTGPLELLNKIRSSAPSVVTRYNLLAKDRSTALWALYMSLFRVGLNRELVYFIAYHSPNNKFKDLRYGGRVALAKDVIRAELASKIQLPDIKAKIREARKLPGDTSDKLEYIAKCVREYLEQIGTFVHAEDDTAWFIRNDNGKPVHITQRSEQLNSLIDTLFGINATEREASYIINNLLGMILDLPVTGKVTSLSTFDDHLKTFVLHTGRKDVLVVTPDSITREVNGYNGLIFPWIRGNNTISPNYKALDRPWEDELFDDCLNNIIDLEPNEAKALLKVWFLSILLRDGIPTRPILALFGQPGSGKSTLFRRMYTIIYGRDRSLSTVTKEDDFDYAMARDPVVVLDNVDSYARWLPDRLAACVSPTEIIKRKLFTDAETVTIRRQALIGITAHSPKFGREDVTDRLLMLNFERLKHFKPENAIFSRIMNLRNALWGGILQDIQNILRTPIPQTGYPQFRIEDFAQLGYWIATACGIAPEFSTGIEKIRDAQRNFSLEEDIILLEAIDRLLTVEPIKEMTAGQLWNKLRRYSRDEKSFDKRYNNAVSLGRKLYTLATILKDVYDVEYSVRKNVRVWTVVQKPSPSEVGVGVNGTEAGR